MHTSRIQDVYINNLSDSSIFICGSVYWVQSKFLGSKENYLFNIKEINNRTKDTTLIDIPIPVWTNQGNEVDEFVILKDSAESTINIQYIKILSIGSGTTFQIGNSGSVHLESRTIEFKREVAAKDKE